MTETLADAAANFRRAMKHADNLLEVHQRSGGTSAGRRTVEISLNRAVVVITVASWQAAVQDIAKACVEAARPESDAGISMASYNLIAGYARKAIGDFSTPNTQNARNLLLLTGFDPRPHWTRQAKGKREALKPHEFEARLDGWLKIRHAIAHGHASLPQSELLRAVRVPRGRPIPEDPTLRLRDAEDCVDDFRHAVRVTGEAAARHLSVASIDW